MAGPPQLVELSVENMNLGKESEIYKNRAEAAEKREEAAENRAEAAEERAEAAENLLQAERQDRANEREGYERQIRMMAGHIQALTEPKP